MVDGRIDPNGDTLRWLNARNAPRWQRMTERGPGFVNFEAQQHDDNHDFGTDWLDETIIAAAQRYESHRSSTGERRSPMAINDVSVPRGGFTPDHAGHETGLACDLRLPTIEGGHGGVKTTDSRYDSEAMRQQLIAFRQIPGVQLIFLNDDRLIDEELCRPLAGHDHHAHIQIRPPQRRAP